MIAAGGVMLLMLLGFALEGLFSGDDETDSTSDGSEMAEEGRVEAGHDASVYTSDLHDLLFGSDGMGNPGASSDGDAGDPASDPALAEGDFLDGMANDPAEGDDAAEGASDDADAEDGSAPTADPLILFGSAANEALSGDQGDDQIFGEEGDDDLYGDDGQDTLDGGEGADTLDGGDDDDTLILGEGDMATGGDGEDLFQTYADIPEDVPILTDFMSGVDTILVRYDGETPPEITLETDEEDGSTAVFADGAQILHLDGTTDVTMDDVVLEQDMTTATDGDDSLTGSDGNDTLSGGDGDDTITGLDGDDLLNGGTGDDILRGRTGMDQLFGQQGADALTGGDGADLVSGGGQNDLAFGNEGDDTVLGGAGNDELYGDQGADSIAGGTGHDLLHGGEDDDSLDGGDGNDLLFGAEGDDQMQGGAGNDYLLGGFGADEMNGGDGNDTLDGTFTSGDSRFGPFDEDSADTLTGGAGDDHLFLGAGDTGAGGLGADLFESGAYIETDAEAAMVTDFDPSEDQIQISVDLQATPDPNVIVVDFADGTGANIVVDGTTVLRVTGAQGLDPESILIRDIRLDDLAESA